LPATPATLEAALESHAALTARLQAVVPEAWPPEFLDDDALRFTLDRLIAHPDEHGWWMYWVLLRAATRPTLVGTGGYKGPPTPAPGSSAEIGYGIVRDHRRQGLATEVARALTVRAFAVGAVDRVIAETLPELVGSIGVLEKCGFRLLGEGSEAGVIRFELRRADAGGCIEPL